MLQPDLSKLITALSCACPRLPWRLAAGLASAELFILLLGSGNPYSAGVQLQAQSTLTPTPMSTVAKLSLLSSWASLEADVTFSVAWGDVDSDGDLDLAVGTSSSAPNRIYLNEGGMLQTTAAWQSTDKDLTYSVAWGDVDSDGDLDLVVGNAPGHDSNCNCDIGGEDKLYLNEGWMLQTTAAWQSTEKDWTFDVAWGDVDGDGDLDLAAGTNAFDHVYLNEGGQLQQTAAWNSAESDGTTSIDWGDMNGDGNLDLAMGNSFEPNRVYLNKGGMLQTTAAWQSNETDNTFSVAWGDIDRDGDLDLAVGNSSQPSRVYLNEGRLLQTTAAWSLPQVAATNSVAWGDVDGDGDLDLAVGNGSQPSRVYLNERGMLQTTNPWQSNEHDNTRSVAWGDVDGDGDLDLAVGNILQHNRIYLNQGGGLHSTAAWQSMESDFTNSVAWGDVDGDGDLDLAVGNGGPIVPGGHHNRVYLNAGGMLQTTAAWQSNKTEGTSSVAWGDIDGDGDLDLAIGNSSQPSQVYLNEGGQLHSTAAWQSMESDFTSSVAWGDVDGDGDLDLAVGNYNGPERIYLNAGGMLQMTAAWQSMESDSTNSVAWGDVDGDGDLDLAVGNGGPIVPGGHHNRVYLNAGGMLHSTAAWQSMESDFTNSVAWGDVDGDGDLDLAVGNYNGPERIYLNAGGMLQMTAAWQSSDLDYTYSVAWGDVDGDGDLDLAVGNYNGPERVYLNAGGMLQMTAAWQSMESDFTNSVAWGDVDGDGDLDLAVGNQNQPNKVYLNLKPVSVPYSHPVEMVTHLTSDSVSTFSGQLVRALAPANFYAVSAIRQSRVIPITYTLTYPVGESVPAIRAYYSLDGSFSGDRSQWRVARPLMGSQTTDLARGSRLGSASLETGVFEWDVWNSGFFGQSDNVVVRLEALFNFEPVPKGTSGPFQRPFVSAQTFPFRVRSTQVHVVHAKPAGQPAVGVLVYRLEQGKTEDALPYRDFGNRLYRTDSHGYLQGHGELRKDDKLAALWPVSTTNFITFTHNYTLYQTSAKPTTTTLDLKPVLTPGVQVLTVSADNKLLLFNLDVALEWDARKDAQFMQQLQFNLQRTSQLLFDWSNGQAALGQVRIFQDGKRNTTLPGFQPWSDSHIRIYATNRMRPSATEGGIISPTLTYTETVVINGNAKTLSYEAGQVHMGAVWNRYGDSSGTLGEDWPRALAHELGHYLFFLEDNYLGINEQGVLVTIPAEGTPTSSCPSVMNDPYREAQSEFHPQRDWASSGCVKTLSQQSTGRSDWETITKFYPLTAPTESFGGQNQGPNTLPLAVTQLAIISPTTTAQTVETPIFYLTKAEGGTYLPGANAQAYLFQGDWLTDLGQPTLDQVQAWGARPGDRLCIYEATANYLGCEQVRTQDDQVTMKAVGLWQPAITVTPVTSRTVTLNVTGAVGDGKIAARLYPTDAAAPGCIFLQATGSGTYAGTFPTLAEPALDGAVHVWVQSSVDLACTEPQGDGGLETVTAYAIGGNPIHRRARRALARGDGVHRRARRAPAISADGQVIVFGEALEANEETEWYFTLQATSAIPAIPPGRTLVGQAYRLTASTNAPDLSNTSISFGYLGEQVPAGEEPFLRLYFWTSAAAACQPQAAPCWQPLATFVDPAYNVASAKTQGPGLYALLSSLEVPLTNVGWNLFAYPVPGTRPVGEALAAIAGAYSVVYHYQPAVTGEAWQLYAPNAPGWVNDLTDLSFGQGYWIHTTTAATLYLSGQESVQAAGDEGLTPPATFYGTVVATPSSPQPGMVVTAWIDSRHCGESQVQTQDGHLVYVIQVAADDGGANDGCGVAGRTVSFRVNDVPLEAQGVWDNTYVWNLSPQGENQLFLPVVRR